MTQKPLRCRLPALPMLRVEAVLDLGRTPATHLRLECSERIDRLT